MCTFLQQVMSCHRCHVLSCHMHTGIIKRSSRGTHTQTRASSHHEHHHESSVLCCSVRQHTGSGTSRVTHTLSLHTHSSHNGHGVGHPSGLATRSLVDVGYHRKDRIQVDLHVYCRRQSCSYVGFVWCCRECGRLACLGALPSEVLVRSFAPKRL